jgi:hypothetical protein
MNDERPNRDRILAECDPLIRPVVDVIWDGGFITTMSCEGGDGHAAPWPTVAVKAGLPPQSTAMDLALWLIEQGLAGCYVSVRHSVQASGIADTDVVAEWWTQGPVRDWIASRKVPA